MNILKLTQEAHACPADRRYRVELDPGQAFPDDPGAGAVAMVYGPGNTSGTWYCAMERGEIECGEHELPGAVHRWMESIEEYVNDFIEAAFDYARVAKGGGA